MKASRHPKMKWINVKDNMPANYAQEYLVLREFMFLGRPAQAVAYFTGSHWLECNSATVLNDVVYYRRLPKPPKETRNK